MQTQTTYSLRVQAIRSKGQQLRLYVYLPAALAEAISMTPGEEVRWEVLDRRELHLVRAAPPRPRAKRRTQASAEQ